MTLRRKLLLAQAPLGAAVALLALASLWALSWLGDKSDLILRENYRSVLALQRMKEALERVDSAALLLIAGQSAPVSGSAEEYQRVFEANLRVQESNYTEPGEPEATAALRSSWEEYQRLFARFVALDPAARGAFYTEQLGPVFIQTKQGAERVLDMNQTAMTQKSTDAQEAASLLRLGALVTGLVALAVGWLGAAVLTARLLRPLGLLRQAARRIQAGDLDVNADERGGDEIADLAREFNQMADSLRHYRRSAQGELDRAQRAAQSAIESLPDPVWVMAPGGETTLHNGAADTLRASFAAQELGPRLQELLGKISGHVLSGRGAYSPKGYEEALRAPSPEGERFFLPRAAPLYDREGTITGATILLQDITRLRRVDELKDDLVSTVAHELRTPLTSLRLAVHLCAEEAAGPLTEKQQDLLFAAREDCERLRALVDEILDLARIQAGRLDVSPVPTSAASLLSQSADAVRGACEEAGITLREESSAGLGAVWADPERARLIFSNLLSNAIRHTPAGGSITLRAVPEGEFVRFTVIDTGPGIPKERHAALFDKFYQAPGARGGLGLGLYLVRELVLAHRGNLGLESEPGHGSHFWCTLPRVPATPGEQPS